MQRPRGKKSYTFMVIPHDASGKSFSFKVPLVGIYIVVGLSLFSLLLTGSSFIYSAHLSRKLVYYSNAMAKNREQRKVINTFADKTEKVDQAISELVKEDNKLRKLLGLKSWKSKARLSSKVKKDKFAGKTERIAQKLKQVDVKLAERKKSFSELKNWVATVQKRFSSTPSRWPLYGRIVSRYGYRVYPWRGFHTGIDVSGRYGAAVRTTASGRVSFVGWRRGYGKTVIVKHGHGVSTLYAHCSRYAVKVGQKVSKGQVVSYVGNTGYTTGPHLHYEVRKWERPVNPVAYLNLNILSASKIWRK